MTNLIIWLFLGWLPLLIYFLHRNDTRFKKNMVVEVTLPFQARTDPEVLALLKRFLRQSLWVNLVMLLLTIPFFFVGRVSLLISLWMTWIVLAITIPQVPYVRTNLALKRLKAARGWKKTQNQVQYLDLSALPSLHWRSPRGFVLPIAVAFMPLIWDRNMFPLYLALGLSTLAFWFAYRYLYRNKSEMVDHNTQLTRVLTQVRQHNWGIVWLTSAYGFAALSLVSSLLKAQPVLQVLGVILVTFIIGIVTVRVEFKTRRIQGQLTSGSGRDWYVDDDDYWLGGLFYHNPNDKRLLVNARSGINTTFNFARTSGKIAAGLLALLLLALPFTGFFLSLIENQPLSLELTEFYLIAHRGGKNEALKRADIAEVKLLTELPENMTRNWGNAIDKLMSGSYSIRGIGSVRLSLDPTAAPFLLVSMKDGSRYLIGSRQPGEAESVFRQLE